MSHISTKYLCRVILFFWLFSLSTQGKSQHWFSSKGSEFGIFYYPEQWPEDQWERDIKRISSLGFDFIHLAEFSWSKLEPKEGNYQFEWLDAVINLADKNGLKVILGTPSAALPVWLSRQYPEALKMMETGQRYRHNGGRLTASLANPVYQKFTDRIVTKLAERFGSDARVWGWQIGNEPNISGFYDYSPSAEKAFREWLQAKYGTAENMNDKWGAAFWSFEFSDFSQVKAPPRNMSGPNKHYWLDFQRYTSQEIANDIDRQAKIIKSLKTADQFVTTNYAYYKERYNTDIFRTSELDFSAHTMYLNGNRLNHTGDSLYHRLGSGMELAFSTEMAKSTHGFTGIMELQPGQVNWGYFNSMPLPGAVRMWIWHAISLGDEFVCSYRYRQPLKANEQTHHGIMMTDGVTVNQGGMEFVQAMEEMKSVREWMNREAEEPDFIKATKTAFLWSFDNVRDLENHRHHRDWDSWQHIYTYYQALKRMGVKVNFIEGSNIPEPKDYPFLVAPAYQLMSKSTIKALTEYVRQGGNLIMTTRTAFKNEEGHLWEAKIQEPIWKLIGAEISFYDHLPAEYPGSISLSKESYQWHVWGEVITPDANTESWSIYEDQFYQGKTAASHRTLGQGTATFVGVWSDNWEFEYQLLRKLYSKEAGELAFDLPPYVFAEWREGLWVALNYTAKNQVLGITASEVLIGDPEKLEPGAVGIFKMK